MRTPWQGRHARRAAAAAVSGVVAFASLPSAGAAGVPAVAGGGEFDYVEQAAPIPIGTGLTVTDGGTYAGEYVEFEVQDASGTEALTLAASDVADTTAGVVSIVGSSVYLGNGSTADPIGSIDSTFDGQAGSKLRVNFTSEFKNPGFETGDVTDWTPIESRVDLGTTSIAGFVTQDTSTYPGGAPNQDNNEPASAYSWAVRATTDGSPTQGSYALELSSGMQTAQSCDVVHGPAVYSSEFEAAAGDKIYFDWRAFAGSDAYHVFGYIIDDAGNQIEVLDAYTNDTYGTSNWVTKETIIPTSGHYRFVFVAGTFDASCGRAAGARLLIDNVRVFGTKANDTVVQQIARGLQYENTSDDPAASRTVSVTAKSNENGTGTGTITVDITPVDDAPTLAAPAAAAFVNTIDDDTFSPVTGTLSATDPDSDELSFGIEGGVEQPTVLDGVAYTHALTATYATVHVDAASGAYAVVANEDAVNGSRAGDSETFSLTVSSGQLSDSQGLTVDVDVLASVPGAPTELSAAPQDGSVTLDWQEPWWLGGSDVTGYQIQSSTDGTTWQVVTTDTGSTDTSYTVDGLTNGTPYAFRVAAINATGTSAPSSEAAATPRTVPGAPTITSITPANGALTVAVAAPDFDGGAPIDGYQVSTDNGRTWSETHAAEDMTITVYGLRNVTTYPVKARAVNVAGAGAASDAVSAAPVEQPILAEDDDEEPEVPEGTVRLVINGNEVEAKVTATPGGTWVLEGEGFSVELVGVTGDGTPMVIDAQGRLVVEQDGFVQVSGTGFAPGSLVDVWVFSTPHHLGTVRVDANGDFAERLALPEGIAVGEHTVQLNGISADGETRSLSTNLVVVPRQQDDAPADQSGSGFLAETGAEARTAALIAVALILAGSTAMAAGRWRPLVSRPRRG